MRIVGYEEKNLPSFKPAFTYSIFGEEEMIVGYKNLDIGLNARAHDLYIQVSGITWDDKIEPLNPEWEERMDIEAKLKPFLPNSKSFSKFSKTWIGASVWCANAYSEARLKFHDTPFTPPGNLEASYTTNNGKKKFEIYSVNMTDPAANQILKNLKIFAHFFIEAATFNMLDDPDWSLRRWKLWLLYELVDFETDVAPKNAPPKWKRHSSSYYMLAGFATSYRIYVTPDEDALEALSEQGMKPDYEIDIENIPESYDTITASPSRERISQFVILPPWQSQSHGARLYNAMTSSFLSDPTVFEITVEDPNEAFDKLRDINDLLRLNADPTFSTIHLPDTIDFQLLRSHMPVPLEILLPPQSVLSALRHKYNLAPRQFSRLVEMHLLSTIPRLNRSAARIIRKAKSATKEDRHYYFWQLVVKDRVFKKNRDELMQIDALERIDKVQALIPGIQVEYEIVLDVVRKVGAAGGAGKGGEVNGNRTVGASATVVAARKKRKVVLDDDEEEEEAGGAKRAKTEELAR